VDGDAWFLLLVLAGASVCWAGVAAGEHGWRRLSLLWVSTSLASAITYALLAELGGEPSLRRWLGLAAAVCVAIALGVTRSSRAASQRAVSLPAALLVSMAGAVTPLVALYAALVAIVLTSGGGLD
jgi:hypothetical protein